MKGKVHISIVLVLALLASLAGAPAQALNLSDLIELTRIRGGAGKEGYGER